LKTSALFCLDYFPELLPVDMAEIILETRFDDDRQAWMALKYAEAISAVKLFASGLEHDSESLITNKETMNKMYLYVGIAVVNEPNSAEVESVKLTVEDYFQTHPMASVRLEYLDDLVQRGIVH